MSKWDEVRVMTIVYKPGNILQIWDLRTSHSTYPQIQALWLVEKMKTNFNFRYGPTGQSDIKKFELKFQNTLMQISISVRQSVPKS